MDKLRSKFLSLPLILVTSLVLPPLGIVLWWMRPWKPGRTHRIIALIARCAITAALVALTVVYMVRLRVVHIELSGAGWRPLVSTINPEADQRALEQHRAAQRQEAPVPPASPAPQQIEETAAPATAVKSDPIQALHAAKPAPAAASPRTAWTDFRGANRLGIYTDGPILTSWPSGGPQRLWKQPSGGGYSSFVVANGKAWTIDQRRDQEVVAAYDVMSGRELWTTSWKALFRESLGGDGPRSTPVWDDGKLYVLGATGEFRCLEAGTGTTVWAKNILTEGGATNLQWGMAASPLVVGEQVIVTPGGRGRSVASYNKRTGAFLWGALDDQASYVSPILASVAGERQIVLVTGTRLVGLAPESGRLLWEYPWVTMNQINCAQPIVVDPNHVFVSSGYDHGCALVEVAGNGGSYTARAVWENKNLKNRFNSSVLYGGYIYGFDEGIFACIDARTGERKWKGGRYGYGQIILAGENIILLAESGELALLKASPESLQEVARFEAISGKTWNVPALAGGILLVRNEREMAAFKVAP
jgi:outer membrane protein assembly factor BamB